jgi:hypothetical protein
MQSLSVLAVEDGAIIVASPAGERFRLPVDAALRARIASPAVSTDEKRLSPREIQAHVRSGLTAEQVAAMTGAPVEYVERFVGPVLAERAYIVESALAVRLPPETDGARSRTFGAVMGERLDALVAREVRWSSAKEPSGWVLTVAFVADDVQHAARWRFDPKHMRLDPDNVEASTLSQQGVPAALTPRLRAIEPTAPVTIVPPATGETQVPAAARPAAPHGARVAPVPTTEPDRSRFESAAFHFPTLEGPKSPERTRPVASHAQPTTEQPAAEQPTTGQLDQLQRRRGERRPAPRPEPEVEDALPPTRAMDVVETGDVFAPRPAAERRDAAPRPAPPERRTPGSVHQLPVRAAVPEPTTPAEERPTEPLRRRRDRGRSGLAGLEPVERQAPQTTEQEPEQEPEAATPTARPRRGRTSMPSWDEIVFGRDEP